MRKTAGLPNSPFNSLTWGFVYLLKVNDTYKIGTTINLRTRVKSINRELQKAHKPRATVIHYFTARDAIKTEDYLHKMFSSKRTECQTLTTFWQKIKNNGDSEWFLLDESDVEYIKTFGNEV